MTDKLTYADIQGGHEHYFVVVAALDSEGKPHYWLDNATADARFPEGTVWNPLHGTWSVVSNKNEQLDHALWQELANRIQP